MITSIGFTVLGSLPWSGNVRKRAHRMDLWRHDSEWKDTAFKLSKQAVNQPDCSWPIPAKALVTVTYIFPTRTRRDPDNYAAAAKGLIDGLVGVLIRDDDFDHMELRVAGRYSKGQTGVEVRVEAL